jgi:hypothetical protein
MDRRFRSILIVSTLLAPLAMPVRAMAQGQTAAVAPTPRTGSVAKGALHIDVRSSGKMVADDIARPRINGLKVPASSLNITSAVAPAMAAPPALTLDNEMVNDPNQDNIQIFPGTMPFLHSTESEVSLVKAKGNLIAAYNNSSSAIVAPNPSGPGLVFLQLLFGGYSVSKDNGETWTSAYFPPVPGSTFTFGDPALAVAPNGTVYFSQLGADAKGNSTVQVNRSTDGGITWSPGIVVAIDPGSDKEWIARCLCHLDKFSKRRKLAIETCQVHGWGQHLAFTHHLRARQQQEPQASPECDTVHPANRRPGHGTPLYPVYPLQQLGSGFHPDPGV